jgi:DNA-binding NarL/FixJ family response regulator
MKELRCFVVDDEKDARERLVILLGKYDFIRIIGFEGEPEQAVVGITEKVPDLVFVDVEMPRMTGFDLIKAVRKRGVNPGFIFVTGFNQYAIKAIRSEAFDFILKPVDMDELAEALDRFRCKFRDKLPQGRVRPEGLPNFTEREREIIRLIAACKSAREIAEALHISKLTVDTHRKNILDKAGLHKTSELILFARENGLD